MREDIVIIGGGLAGSEAAWQAANRGAKVTLIEMRPKEATPAHKTGGLAELVCSNSLGSTDPFTAAGILKEEMRRQGSLIIKVADEVRVPAGSALIGLTLVLSMLWALATWSADRYIARARVEGGSAD